MIEWENNHETKLTAKFKSKINCNDICFISPGVFTWNSVSSISPSLFQSSSDT